MPLHEQQLAVETTKENLSDWWNLVNQQYRRLSRYLLLRTITLGAGVFVLLVISNVWRRATFTYVKDSRRRRELLLLRRIVIVFAVTLVIILSFVSQFGSLATYAGFLTAGLAVALQNVIVSIVAYFLLMGRYGLRVGDRVTISGVTGNVIDIGLARIYSMEMTGAGPDMHSTGRVVVFSNSVIFQPSALYKQLPGTDHVWHTVSLKLAPDSDFHLAETRLNTAVNSVYEQYRPAIERQYAAFQRSVDMEVTPPRPAGHLRMTDAGLEYGVRYPVEWQNASDTDARMMKALYDSITHEPKLSLAPAGAPKPQPAA